MNSLLVRVLSAAAVCLVAGCGRELQFRVVDASSGEPLLGAKVKVRRVTSLDKFKRNLDIREAGLTDTNGFISVPGVTKKHHISFDAAGHFGAGVALAHNQTVTIHSPFTPSRSGRPWVTPQKVVTNSQGTIIIPLIPLPIGQ
jgi:hypothetical protein